MNHLLAICTFFGALVFAVVPAGAQEFGSSPMPSMVWDVIEMRESQQGIAEVFYSNSADQASSGADRVYSFEHPTFGLIEAHIHIQINGEGQSEVITVTPLNPQHMAFPPEAAVVDGESIVIQIMGGVS